MLAHRLTLSVGIAAVLVTPLRAADLPKITKVERQPLAAQAKRIADALDFIGAPLSVAEKAALKSAAADKDEDKGIAAIQDVLDKHCLAGVQVLATPTPKGGPAFHLKVQAGPAKPELAEQGWRVFLIKVDTGGAKDLELRADSPNALPLHVRSTSKPDPKVISVGEVGKRFLDLQLFNSQPLVRDLSGLELEYRILQIYCRDAGRKEAGLGFSLWSPADKKKPAGKSELTTVLFESIPAVVVKLRVKDFDGKSSREGKPVMGSFTFRDSQGRIYPSPTRRLAPDFFFHAQVYRADGESINLQPGKYTVRYTRGPEYLVLQKEITVPKAKSHIEEFQLKRWVHPAARGWWSGDHHIHAAGCQHYESPTEGVTPADMMRHVQGEDLNVGCCLSWGPCWYHQKRYFQGKINDLSTASNLLRYDVEVSGFPSSHCGHICLLRLSEQDYRYPDDRVAKVIEDWPSWDLPIFRWAKSKEAVVGFAHSGWGLQPAEGDPNTRELPNYLLPLMNGIGANEYLVDVALGMCDFISTVDTPSVYELNIWYHTLNCGYRCRISGETDFPCIYGERVGLGRSYVHLDGKLDFYTWAEGIKKGRCYVSDGKSHLMDFTVNGAAVGVKKSEVKRTKADTVQVKARVAALLEPKITKETERIRKSPLTAQPYWDVERARIGETRKVPVEVIVNGLPVDKKEIVADGKEHEVEFAVPIKTSSWICLRILPSSHTNPVFVLVDDKPIRASKKSAEWCVKAIDQCWKQKVRGIRKEEQKEAKAAYDEAREMYKKIAAECAEQ
jgi:hypothetical protein